MRVDEAWTHAGSSGKALYPNEIRISHVDEILVRGPVVMKGYYNSKSHALSDGWLHTGDAGRLDDDGYLYVLDRRDDLIITGGENVYPAEVEAVLSAHPSVEEACVIGIFDGKWGQRVVAIVKARSAPDENALREHCSTRLARFKQPAEFRFVDSPLPRTASGKLKRGELRAAAILP
jgi:O-succinylbenzoic acid--CoA ligase